MLSHHIWRHEFTKLVPGTAIPPVVACSWSIATHNTDFLSWIVGARATQVYAQARTFSHLKAPAQSVMAQITYANGALATCGFPQSSPHPACQAVRCASRSWGLGYARF